MPGYTGDSLRDGNAMWTDGSQTREVSPAGKVVPFLLYNLVILLVSPAILAFLGMQCFLHKRYRESLGSRLGFLPDAAGEYGRNGPAVWIHAVSMGEVMAAIPLVRGLRKCYPGARLMISTVTDTGQATARQKLPEVDRIIYFPFDLPWVVHRVIRKFRPALFVFLETEIWPNFLFALSREGIPTVMVNGHISSRSYRGYRMLAPFFRKVLEGVHLFSVQTERDRERLIALGVNSRRVVKTGNMKYDQVITDSDDCLEEVRKALRLGPSHRLVVAGSTHEGEEEALTDCYMALSQKYPDIRLLLAPRHLVRLERIEEHLQRRSLRTIRRTKIDSGGFHEVPPDTVILLDTLGELQRLYAVSSLVFVGGSLVPVGGHNVLEPAAFAKPVLFGPYLDHWLEIAQLLVERQGAFQVSDQCQLLSRMDWLLAHPEECQKMGRQARQVILEQQGVVEKNIALIRGILEGTQ